MLYCGPPSEGGIPCCTKHEDFEEFVVYSTERYVQELPCDVSDILLETCPTHGPPKNSTMALSAVSGDVDVDFDPDTDDTTPASQRRCHSVSNVECEETNPTSLTEFNTRPGCQSVDNGHLDTNERNEKGKKDDLPHSTRDLLKAFRAGRTVEAHREIQRLEAAPETSGDPYRLLGSSGLERIRRISARFVESLEELDAHRTPERDEEGTWLEKFAVGGGGCGWTEMSDDEAGGCGLKFASRVRDSLFQVVTTVTYEGLDVMQAFVGICEYDLCSFFDTEVVETEPLKQRSTDGLWRVLKRCRHGGLEDNIMRVSFLDALDEPLGALWFSSYTPAMADLSEGLSEISGVAVPPRTDGCARLSHYRSVVAITPLWDRPCHFRMTCSWSLRPSKAAYMFPSVVRGDFGELLRRFKDFVETCRELNYRTIFSHHAPFYDEVRRHLAAKCPVALLPSILSWSELSWEIISQHVPEDWADGNEYASISAEEPQEHDFSTLMFCL
eukprot:gnl/TRDRNA2_/TRDRNA2_197486_c0_seq1.p1 gnl/TRDRNA2_/TRDRNA2_197486_c0~~gnl/TRDRNA2_/TRDRNA2_197486_c0_seq1.p1  ORF type:complete len:499 (+),score=53.74 gnl/TRDRNA2_/TRDRNA2_197486_c0_seq1:27-1523(+)